MSKTEKLLQYIKYILTFETGLYLLNKEVEILTSLVNTPYTETDVLPPVKYHSETGTTLGVLALVFFGFLFLAGITENGFVYFIILCLLVVIIYFCIKKVNEENRETERWGEYNKIIALNKTRRENDAKRKIELRNNINFLNYYIPKLENSLHILYYVDIIYEKYRNIVAMSSIYEYFDAGRCNTLVDDKGAYNLYETECRANAISNSWSIITRDIQAIKNNQYILYKQLEQANSIIEKMFYIGLNKSHNVRKFQDDIQISKFLDEFDKLDKEIKEKLDEFKDLADSINQVL